MESILRSENQRAVSDILSEIEMYISNKSSRWALPAAKKGTCEFSINFLLLNEKQKTEITKLLCGKKTHVRSQTFGNEKCIVKNLWIAHESKWLAPRSRKVSQPSEENRF